jgi:hypothetical protein
MKLANFYLGCKLPRQLAALTLVLATTYKYKDKHKWDQTYLFLMYCLHYTTEQNSKHEALGRCSVTG